MEDAKRPRQAMDSKTGDVLVKGLRRAFVNGNVNHDRLSRGDSKAGFGHDLGLDLVTLLTVLRRSESPSILPEMRRPQIVL